MPILALETSGAGGSIAVVIDGRLAAERTLSATGRRHARTLVPEMGELLRDQGLRPRDVKRVAVSLGPGSFTGLRVGVVCAKTFAYANGCELAGVDTFLAVAAAQPDVTECWIIDDALRGDVYAARYKKSDAVWTCVERLGILPLAEFIVKSRGQYVTGPGMDKYSGEFTEAALGDGAYRHPQAAQVGLLAWEWSPELLADPWTLEPFYIRRSAAEENADG